MESNNFLILVFCGILVIFVVLFGQLILSFPHIQTYQYTINGTVENKGNIESTGFGNTCLVTIKDHGNYYVHDEPLCSNLTVGENTSLIITTFNPLLAENHK